MHSAELNSVNGKHRTAQPNVIISDSSSNVTPVSVLIFSDLFSVVLCVLLARCSLHPSTGIGAILLAVSSVSFVLGLALLGLYPGRGMWGPSRIRSRTLVSIISFVSPGIAALLFPSFGLNRVAAECFLVGMTLPLVSSFVELVVIRIADQLGFWRTQAVFVGDAAIEHRVRRDLLVYPELGLKLGRGTRPVSTIAQSTIRLGSVSDPDTFVLDQASPLPIYYPLSRPVASGHRADVEPIARVLKRCIDIVGASVVLVFALPLMIVIGVGIFLANGWPILYFQERGGYQGRPFRVWKFRTMYRDAQQRLDELLATDEAARAEWAKHFKLRTDPRILPRIGKILRKSSFDELPQLWNVLRGDMSMVGPRPFPEAHLAVFSADFRALRAQAVPGLSGLWQVTMRSNGEIGDQEHLDRVYVEGWSIWLDLYVLVRTPLALLSRNGAM